MVQNIILHNQIIKINVCRKFEKEIFPTITKKAVTPSYLEATAYLF